MHFHFSSDGYLLLDVISTSNYLPVTRGCGHCLLSKLRSFIPTTFHWKVFTIRSSKEAHCKLSKNFTQSLRANFSQRGSNVLHTPERMNQHTSFRPYCVDFEGIYATDLHESMQWFSRLIRSCNIEVLKYCCLLLQTSHSWLEARILQRRSPALDVIFVTPPSCAPTFNRERNLHRQQREPLTLNARRPIGVCLVHRLLCFSTSRSLLSHALSLSLSAFAVHSSLWATWCPLCGCKLLPFAASTCYVTALSPFLFACRACLRKKLCCVA